MTRRYAERTEVASGRSRQEIEDTLTRYGATAFAYAWKGKNALISFEMRGRQIRFVLPLPDPTSTQFTRTPSKGLPRSAEAARDAYEQAVRQSWRALLLVIKAKLEAIEAGITDFESEFLAATLLPGNRTVGDWMLPQVERAYLTGEMPPMLPMLPAPEDD